MLDVMQKELSEDIQKAYKTGKVSALEIKSIVKNAVSKAVKNAKTGTLDINVIAKEAVVTVVKELKSAGIDTKEHIEAVVDGTIEGTSDSTKRLINDIDIELLKTKYRLQEHQENLSVHLKDAFNGANEAASTFSDKSKDEIEDAVTNAKLMSIEILGLMQETIRQSVKTVINEGKDVEQRVANITKDATENALAVGRFSTQKAKEVSEAAILAAIEAAQEAGSDVKAVSEGAIAGTKQGIVNTIEKAKAKLSEAKSGAEDFVEEDIRQTIEDFESIENAFIEALIDTANKVGDAAKETIQLNVDAMKENASEMKKSAEAAADAAVDYLKEKGSQAAYSTKEKALDLVEATYDEIEVLSEKMLKITKGALSGMVEGAKKAMKQEEGK